MSGQMAPASAGAGLACAVAGYGLQHYILTGGALLVAASALVYRVLSPALLPGRDRVMNVVLPGEVLPQPHAGALNFWSPWRCRWAWWRYARSRGMSAKALAKKIRNDYEIDWLHGERPQKGDVISAWDRVIVWADDCIDMALLEGMRDLSDDLSDKALDTLHNGPSSGQDVLESIADHVVARNTSDNLSQDGDDLSAFWQAVDRRPPLGCGVVSAQWLREHGIIELETESRMGRQPIDLTFVKEKCWHPRDVDKIVPAYEDLTPQQKAAYDAEEARSLSRGKTLFHTYGPNIELGLLLVGLGGGFASGRITDVLRSTGYLMSASKVSEPADGVDSATLGGDATEADYLARLATYVDRASEELQRKGIVGGEKVAEKTSAKDETQQSVPSQASSDRTYKRLLETAAFLLDVTETDDSLTPPCAHPDALNGQLASTGADLLKRGGKGWLACARVRFLHTGVRRRLLSPSSKAYPRGSGIPINQEDLLATLCAFSAAPLMALQAQGLTPTEQEVVDYIALWRHIGFYLGVEPRLLRRCFRDVHSAQAIFACISSHHFLPLAGRMDSSTPPPPSISSAFGPKMFAKPTSPAQLSQPILHFDHGPALPLLWGVSDRPPGNMAFSTLCAIARFLLGDALANATALPATTTSQYIGLRLRLFVLAYPPLFARYYPRKQWGIRLRTNWMTIVRRLVLYASKGHVAQYKSRIDSVGSHKASDTATTDDLVVELDAAEGKRIVREHHSIMREMAIVSLSCIVVAVGTFYFASQWTYSLLHHRYAVHCL